MSNVLRETDYDDIISLEYRKKSAVRTALENLIQEESHADGKDEHFATLTTLESPCDPKRKPLRSYVRSPTLVWESTVYKLCVFNFHLMLIAPTLSFSK